MIYGGTLRNLVTLIVKNTEHKVTKFKTSLSYAPPTSPQKDQTKHSSIEIIIIITRLSRLL